MVQYVMAGKLNKHDVPTPQQRGSPAYGLQTKFRFSKSENKLNQKEKSEQNLKLIKVSETNQIEAKKNKYLQIFLLGGIFCFGIRFEAKNFASKLK